MTDKRVEQEARELLAQAYTEAGFHGAAGDALAETPSPHCAVTIRAIVAALTREQREGYDAVLCRECGQPTMHVGTLCYACAHKPQQEEPGAVACWRLVSRFGVCSVWLTGDISADAARQAIADGNRVERAYTTPPAPVDVRVALPKVTFKNAQRGDCGKYPDGTGWGHAWSAPIVEIERADWDRFIALISGQPAGVDAVECHGLDTPERVCFYEQDFYVLSNFSSFSLHWKFQRFATSEAAYHYEKFSSTAPSIAKAIRLAISAHEAFKIAEAHKERRRPDWDDVKLDVMRDILRAKADQHEYVRRKLLATGDRELVENSWRDDFWGWGPNKDGQNWLGRLWMEVRQELRTAALGGGGER